MKTIQIEVKEKSLSAFLGGDVAELLNENKYSNSMKHLDIFMSLFERENNFFIHKNELKYGDTVKFIFFEKTYFNELTHEIILTVERYDDLKNKMKLTSVETKIEKSNYLKTLLEK